MGSFVWNQANLSVWNTSSSHFLLSVTCPDMYIHVRATRMDTLLPISYPNTYVITKIHSRIHIPSETGERRLGSELNTVKFYRNVHVRLGD